MTALQVLHLTKQHAYFPEHRRFAESNIQVPLSADSAASLAAGCRRLRALRLSLGASDVTPEGLAALKDFSNLKRCVRFQQAEQLCLCSATCFLKGVSVLWGQSLRRTSLQTCAHGFWHRARGTARSAGCLQL